MNFTSRSRLTRLRALAVLATIPIAGACTYDFAQFEGLSPPADNDAGQSGRGGAGGAGKDAAADGMTGKGASSGTAGSGQSGSGGAGATGGSGSATGGSGGASGSGGAAATGGSGGAGATAGSGGSVGGSGGKGGAAGSAGSAGSSGTGGNAPDASIDGPGGTGGATGGSGGTTGGSGGATGGGAGSGGTPIPDASDVKVPPDAAPDNRIVDIAVDTPFDCGAVSGTAYQGHCYYAKSVAVDWNTANTTTCQAPAHLATITTAGEQAVVQALLSTQDRWIGLRRPTNSPQAESSFYWVTNEVLSYRNWDVYSDADKEPNGSGECVRMRFTNMWADALCTDALAVICEHE